MQKRPVQAPQQGRVRKGGAAQLTHVLQEGQAEGSVPVPLEALRKGSQQAKRVDARAKPSWTTGRRLPQTADLGTPGRYWHSCDAIVGHKADKSVLAPQHCHAEHDRLSAWVSSTGKLRHEGCLKGLSSSALVPGCIRCCGRPRHAHASRRHPPPDSGRHH